ncbi:TPA: hypothetical protein PJH04_002906 [Escherichia coli]|nr:hypothetical protein [Escherichia coli]
MQLVKVNVKNRARISVVFNIIATQTICLYGGIHMFLASGLVLSAIAYFITNEGINSVIFIMLNAFFWHYLFSKSSSSHQEEKENPSSFSEYMFNKYGYFRESPKNRRKLTDEERVALNNKLSEWNQVINELESNYWLDTVKLHLKELNATKGINSEPNYSMMYYQEVRQKMLHEAKGNIYNTNIALK